MNDERKTLVLTGASRGIGHATVKRFNAAGWRVITCSRQPFSENCPWEAGSEDHVVIDLGDRKGITNGIETLRERLNKGPLHALVNNAGISPKGVNGQRFGVLDGSMEMWRNIFEINFFGPAMLARSLVDQLEEGKGSIVNVTSIVGGRVHPFAGTAYAASKAALAALTREMAADLGVLGIRVNAIAPGEIETAMIGPQYKALADQIPLRRLGTPEEVAKTIYFLCTDQASYVNGAEIHINGGQHV